jgi:cyclic-di-GMP phosphodiesterase TipF (flagellum assembly factor)
MRRLILPLLTASYFSLSLIFAVLIWRNGGGWGAGVAGLAGALGLCFTFHGLITGVLGQSALRKEVETLRHAHRLLVGQIEQIDARVGEVLETVALDAQRRSEELSTEVQLLEDLVTRMSERLDERLAEGPGGHSSEGPRPGWRERLQTVREALVSGRVDLYLQPVVNLPQRRTLFYESYTRLRDESGRVLMPAEFLTVAEPEGLVAAVDNLLLFRCVQIVRRLAQTDKKVGIFCNISTSSLSDEGFFPQFLELMAQNRDLAGSVIFEIGQSAYDTRTSTAARNMARLAELGFRFSLDKVRRLDMDFQELARSDVRFLKIGAQSLQDEIVESGEGPVFRALPDLAAQDFATLARRYGVDIIAEKIEDERQTVEVLELDIAFGQGHLFGEPRAIRGAILAETDPPADYLQAPLRRRAGERA